MQKFAETCDLIAATTKKLQKTAILVDYFKSLPTEDAGIAAVFLSGRPFAVCEEATLQVGGTMLWRMVGELSDKPEQELNNAYRRYGDLGAVAEAVLPRPENGAKGLITTEIQAFFREIAITRGATAKAARVRDLLSRLTPKEAKYVIKIMTGELRIGLKESLVEEAIAKAYGSTLPEIQRANMLLGDIGETLTLAAESRLAEAAMRLFHPLGFMLASPMQSAEEALSYFEKAVVEDKYDGVRAQAHCSNGNVRIFSRTRDDITESFPELAYTLAVIPQDAILDGEIVAWSQLSEGADPGRAQPFSALQKRLGRKQVSDKMIEEVPVAYLVFDLLYRDGELLIDNPLHERAARLDALLAVPRASRAPTSTQTQFTFNHEQPLMSSQLIRAPAFQAHSSAELDQLFEAAQARGNEGLMIKDAESPYTPGRRGKSWLKLKRELATLDVVVTAVEYGHGKRIGVLSDYTFAVRDGDRLVNIGKAYSGLTDAEITEMTKWFLDHTVENQGFTLVVEPKIVIEVAFNNMMRSDRHNSGFALRFPRIVRLRPDKRPEEADTIETVRKIYAAQHNPGSLRSGK